jgi:preprotein translocase subunit SecD
MNFCGIRFNLYLLLLLTLLTAAGCQTHKQDKKDKEFATLRFHIENKAQVAGSGKTVTVLRAEPVLVTINIDPILTENNIVKAALLETPGGYAIEVKFDETGTWMLEQYTSANSGRHFAIFSQWSEKASDSRWIAAPIISHRIANGIYSFTPDASREEAQAIVTGLNNMAEKVAKEQLK